MLAEAIGSADPRSTWPRQVDAEEAKELLAQGATLDEVAERYGVTKSRISSVCLGVEVLPDPAEKGPSAARALLPEPCSCEGSVMVIADDDGVRCMRCGRGVA